MFEPSDWEIATRAVEILVPMAHRGDPVGIRELRFAEADLLFSAKTRRQARVDLRPVARSRAGKPVATPAEDAPEQMADAIKRRAMGGG